MKIVEVEKNRGIVRMFRNKRPGFRLKIMENLAEIDKSKICCLAKETGYCASYRCRVKGYSVCLCSVVGFSLAGNDIYFIKPE